MKRLIVGIIVLAIAAMNAQSAFAKRAKDNPNYGYCPDGKRVTDVAKCAKQSSSKKK